jgi:hypothetical protein
VKAKPPPKKAQKRRPRWKPRVGRFAARYTFQTVLALQGAVLLTFFVDPSNPPASEGLSQLLWALAHKPSFYPVAALVLVGLPITFIALMFRGKHRINLALTWATFLTILAVFHQHRIVVMIQILYEQKDKI